MTQTTMKAADLSQGTSRIVELARPKPTSGEVLVRVVAASVNAGESKVVAGDFVGRFLHARTNPLILGWDFSGEVVAVGAGVEDLAEGQSVWGHLEFAPTQKQGTFAEFLTIPRECVGVKPESVSHPKAAATPTVSMTGLQSLRDLGGVTTGSRVLIVGAAGGIGAISVGIARRLGAHVTAICSTKDVARVESLGADAVVDRKKTDPFSIDGAFDVVFDTPAVYSYGKCSHLLARGGTYVTTLPSLSLISGMARALVSSKKCSFVQVASKSADLELVGSWLEDGLKVSIDSEYPIKELDSALARQGARDRAGRVVVTVEDGWE